MARETPDTLATAPMNKIQSSTIATVMAALPLACYALLVAAACYTWVAVGNWPSYGNPDPSDLPVQAVYTIAITASLAGITSVLLLPIAELAFLGARRLWRKEWRSHGKRVIVLYGIGAMLWIVGVLRWRMDGGGLVNWIFD
jgi:hypothetical protein